MGPGHSLEPTFAEEIGCVERDANALFAVQVLGDLFPGLALLAQLADEFEVRGQWRFEGVCLAGFRCTQESRSVKPPHRRTV